MMLRWIERSEPAPELGPGIGRNVRVLQMSSTEQWSFKDETGKPLPGWKIVWMDVPFEPNP